MAKKSSKRLPRSEKDPTGCLSGLINMFDFRQGHSSTKLLSARRCGSGSEFGGNYSEEKVKSPSNFESIEEISGVDESREESAHAVFKGAESLVEGDISRVHLSKKNPSEEIELIPPETGPEVYFQNKYKQASQRYKGVTDLVNDLKEYTSLKSQKTNGMDSTEKISLDFDLAAFMTNFHSGQCQLKHLGYKSADDLYDVSKTGDHEKDNHSEGLNFELVEKQVMLHKSLVDVANVFDSQKFTNSKHLSVDLQPREFMEALEILNTNKQLLLSLLQNPDSLLLKLVHDHQNAQVGKLSDLESSNSLTIEVAEGIGSSGKRAECFTPNMLNKQRGYKLFRRKDKPNREKSSEMSGSSHTLDKIVILKPRHSSIQNPSIAAGPSSSPISHNNIKFQGDREKVATHFSLKEIKRRLQKVIGSSRRARHVISMEGVMHRIPYGSKDSASLGKDSTPYALTNKAYYGNEYGSSSPSALSKGDEKDNPEDNNNFVVSGNDRRLNKAVSGHLVNREYIDEEAKKHLAYMLDSCRDNSDMLHTRGVSKSLGRLLYLQEYDISPRSTSPPKDRGPLSPTEVSEEDVTANHLSPLMPDIETMSCTNEHPNEEADVVDLASEPTHTQTSEETSIIEENQKESIEIVEADIISNEECGRVSAKSEYDCIVSGGVSERCTEDESPAYSGREVINIENHGSAQDTSPATPPLSKPCRSLLKQIFKDHESIQDMSEHPSPVSVLEPFDANSYGSEQDESPISPRTRILAEDYANPDPPLTPSAFEDNVQPCIHNCADISEYVKMVLERSSLNGNEISDRWLSSEHLIDPSLVNEVGISCSQLDDPQLLFDCTSEVIMELQERVFSCTPWVSRLKHNVRPIPVNNNLIHEVCKAIERHLHWQSPRALDQIISEDMDSRTWLEVQSDTESIVMETGNLILEELIREAAFELWI